MNASGVNGKATDLLEVARAAVRYDDAIQACANDPDAMSSYCTAEGDTLDALYADWIGKARAAIAAHSVQPMEAPSFKVGDVVRHFHHGVMYGEAVVLEASPAGALTVRDVETGTIYGWSSRMVQLAPAAGAPASHTEQPKENRNA